MYKKDVSDYDMWVTLGGTQKGSTPTPEQIDLSLRNAMKIFWDLRSITCTSGHGIFNPEITEEPKQRVCLSYSTKASDGLNAKPVVGIYTGASGGSLRVIGFEELNGFVSDPPKKYLKKVSIYRPEPDGPEDSMTVTYDPYVYINQYGYYDINRSKTTVSTDGNISDIECSATYGFNCTSTTTEYRKDLGEGESIYRSMTLSEENTDSMVISAFTDAGRFQGPEAAPPYDDFPFFTNSTNTSYHSEREGEYVRKKMVWYYISCDNLRPGNTYKVSVTITKRTKDKTGYGEDEHHATDEYSFDADSESYLIGGPDDLFQLPHVYGYEYRISDSKIEWVKENYQTDLGEYSKEESYFVETSVRNRIVRMYDGSTLDESNFVGYGTEYVARHDTSSGGNDFYFTSWRQSISSYHAAQISTVFNDMPLLAVAYSIENTPSINGLTATFKDDNGNTGETLTFSDLQFYTY